MELAKSQAGQEYMIWDWPPPPTPEWDGLPRPLVVGGGGRAFPPLWCGVGKVEFQQVILEFGSRRCQKYSRSSQENRTLSEAGSKMNNCVSTALARADRGSDPAEKAKKKRPANQHTYDADV